MGLTSLIILLIVLFVVVFVVVNLFRLTLNEFLQKTIENTLWLWLPFHALKRLLKEFWKKMGK